MVTAEEETMNVLDLKAIRERAASDEGAAGERGTILALVDECERLREERDTEAGIRIRAVEQMVRYRKALKRYGQHDVNCERVLLRSSREDRRPCSCGYQAALDGDDR